MTDMIAFEIYRTEDFTFDGERFSVRFMKRKDRKEYALYATNDLQTKSWTCSYSTETAADFMAATGKALKEDVYKIFKGDVESKVLK